MIALVNNSLYVPKDIFRLIAHRLNAKDLSAFACVCRTFNAIANEKEFALLRRHVLINRNVRDLRYEIKDGFFEDGYTSIPVTIRMGNHMFTLRDGYIEQGNRILGRLVNPKQIRVISNCALSVLDGNVRHTIDFGSQDAQTSWHDAIFTYSLTRGARTLYDGTLYAVKAYAKWTFENWNFGDSFLRKTSRQIVLTVLYPYLTARIVACVSRNEVGDIYYISQYFSPQLIRLFIDET